MSKQAGKRQTIICVVALQKSGTTWFGTQLSALENTVNLGEVWASLYTDPKTAHEPSYICTCGALMTDCDFWGPIIKSIRDDESNLDRHRRVLERFRNKFPDKVLLDSAKYVDILTTSWLAPELADQVDVRFIHLVRDYRPWALSRKNSHNSKGRPRPLYLQILRWWLRNTKRDRYLQRCGRPVLQVTYESLVFDAEPTWQRILEFTGLQQPTVMPAMQDLSLHICRGNKARRDLGNFSRIRYDNRWTRDSRFLWLSVLLLPMHRYWKSFSKRASSR